MSPPGSLHPPLPSAFSSPTLGMAPALVAPARWSGRGRCPTLGGGCKRGCFFWGVGVSCTGLELPWQDPGTALAPAGQHGAFTVPFLWGGGGG